MKHSSHVVTWRYSRQLAAMQRQRRQEAQAVLSGAAAVAVVFFVAVNWQAIKALAGLALLAMGA